MDDAVRIRAAVSGDHAGLGLVFEELDRFHQVRAPWLFHTPEVDPRPPAYLDALLKDPGAGVFVADAGECVGVAIVLRREPPDSPVFIRQAWAVIDGIAVRSDFRRRGIGRMLLDACQRWAHDHDAAWLELGVYEFNTEARSFYEAMGFQTVLRRMRRPLSTDDR